jgi:hypothetical protein
MVELAVMMQGRLEACALTRSPATARSYMSTLAGADRRWARALLVHGQLPLKWVVDR